MRVLVIGGGASGMMAALTAAEDPANSVVLLERQARVGRKLAVTGNGRCNLTNRNAELSHYHGASPAFAAYALSHFTVSDTIEYFQTLGLLTVTEASGRVYPYSDQAGSVVDVLRLSVEAAGVQVETGAEVLSLQKRGDWFQARTQERRYAADAVIVACGGAAGGKVGGCESGYALLKSFGHHATRLLPALVQLRTETGAVRALKGVRAECGLTLLHRGKEIAASRGEVQFTDYGVSGPAVFELSRSASAAEGECELLLDLFPPFSASEIAAFLRNKTKKMPQLPMEELLTGMLQNRLGRTVLRAAGFSLSRPCGELSGAETDRIAEWIKCFRLTVTGTLGMDQAQVTAGGVRTDEFDPESMESRLCGGLYACGEVLDVDGDCGGYNLQWAWSSGRLAGKLKGMRT